MRRRLVFIGIDCLDLYLVLKWRMKGYIIGDYGYHFVGYDLYTPVIWAKILTGIDVTKTPYNFNSKNISRKKRLISLYYLRNFILTPLSLLKVNNNNNSNYIRIIFKKVLTGEKLSLRERVLIKMLKRSSLAERLPTPLRWHTIPMLAAKQGHRVAVLEFPPLNDEIYSLLRNMLYFYISASPEEKDIFLHYIWKVTTSSVQMVLHNLGKKNLIYWYTPYIDVASHIYYRPGNIRYMLTLRQIYSRLEKLIKKVVKEALEAKYEVIIASDHGFNPRVMDHSHYGYWSTSFKPHIVPRRAEDIALLTKRILNI